MHRLTRQILGILAIGLTVVASCTPPAPSLTPTLDDIPTTIATDTPSNAPTTASDSTDDPIRTITIFYTSDEHGYLEPIESRSRTLGGAANLLAALRERGYDPDGDDALLISGGDMWTGPAISTWFQGSPAVQVFNALGYDSATIGNHDFDFGRDSLQANADAAEFPFLTTNVTQSGGDPPAFAQPYVIREVNGVQVAIVGLTTLKTPGIVMPTSIEGLAFGNYAAALNHIVPQARAEGAELVIVASHICARELRRLAPVAAELEIPFIGGGHCHTSDNVEQNGVRIVGPGEHWQTFAQVEIDFDTTTGQATGTRAELVPVEYTTSAGNPLTPDAEIATIVAGWQAQVNDALGETIGYIESGIERNSWAMYNLLVDAWLWYYPQADIAISNLGGYREDIPPGEITRADIVATWPFDNTLIDVELTGQQVMDNLLCCGGAVAGLVYHRAGANIIAELDDGSPLDPDAVYHVLVNNFSYYGGDDYLFLAHNPDGYETGIHWRDPVIEWIIAQETSSQRPLDALLNDTKRGPGR